MRKSILLALFVALLIPVYAFAEEAVQAPAEVTPEAVAPVEAVAEVAAVATEVPAAILETPAEEAVDNLEFVSGEVSAANEADKSVTVKLYGENDNQPTEKTLTVTIDEATDITDGETDKDIKALNVGTEVDVEYDPKTSKATYIFVY